MKFGAGSKLRYYSPNLCGCNRRTEVMFFDC